MALRYFLVLSVLASAARQSPAALASTPSGPVQVDQVGYAPTDHKWVAVGRAAPSFEVRRRSDDGLVASLGLSPRRIADPASGDDVYSGDFSTLVAPGEYYVRVPGVGDSPVFTVRDGTYDTLYREFLNGLYYQRCGTAIPSQFGGNWTHAACHDDGSSIASYNWDMSGEYRNTIGGWHDAGDYGKYSINNAYAVGILLQAYELYPAKFAFDDCAIPESGNGAPDLLDEARWSLEWMLKLQEPSGAVIHRESIASYAGDFVPESDAIPRYFTSISSDATAMHAAAMALAARVYRGFDATFAAACSSSAVAASNWLEAHPSRVPAGGFVNLYGHTGATYNLDREESGRLWAAAEIHRLNGSAAARGYVDAHWGEGRDFDGVWYPDAWSDVANMGAFTYRDSPGATPSVVAGNWWSVENSTIASAATWAARADQDGYGCVASTSGAVGDYYWGFTGVVLRYAWTMLQAFRFSGNPAYEESAKEQLHYILGRNPMGKVYLTGIGYRPVLHAHGAWNSAAGYTNLNDALCHPVPYLLIGGPNKADNSAISPYPARCYEDIADPAYDYKGNFTLNETSINIQAALIALAGYFGSGGAGTVDSSAPRAARVPGMAIPNPFRVQTAIVWPATASTPGSRFRARVFDVSGRSIAELSGRVEWDSSVRLSWNGNTQTGTPAQPGVYFVTPERSAAPALRVVRVN